MIIKELLTKLGFEVDKKALNDTDKLLDGIKHRLSFLAAAEIAKGLFHLGERFGKLGGELAAASASAGITVEEFQKLTYAAQQSNVSAEEMEQRLSTLAKKLYDAKNGSMEAGKAFSDVGIGSDQIQRFKTSREALDALSDRFAKIQDPIKKQALAQELLGRGSIHMVGFLSKGSAEIHKQGNELERLGLVIGEHDVQALEKLENAFQKIWSLLKAIGGSIASYIAPVFSYMVDDFIKWFKINKDVIGLNIRGFLNAFAYGLGFVYGGVKLLVNALIELAHKFNLDGSILPTIAKFAGLVAAVLTVIKVVKILAAAWAILTSPILLVAAAIAAVIVAVHDLIALFKGNETWIGKAMAAVGGFSGLAAKAKGFLGFGEEAQEKAGALNSPGVATGGIASNSSTTVGATSTAVNAPMTFNIPAGADPKDVSTKAKEGIMEHLARVQRETQRSTAGAVAY